MREDIKGLKALGVSAQRNKKSYQFEKPDSTVIECFDRVDKGCEMLVTFHSKENLQSLCPLTGQPDSCNQLWIQYIPNVKMIESKSLKLYLNGFRNFGCFHEEIACIICKDLYMACKPRFMRVMADYEPRGGIAIMPSAILCDTKYVLPGRLAQQLVLAKTF